MRRIGTSDSLFHNGDPFNGVQGTVVTAEWLNSVQEEIVSVLSAAGIALNSSANNQLLAAIKSVINNSWTGINTTGGNTILNATQLASAFIVVTGALTSNASLIFSGGYSRWTVINATTGNFTLACYASGGGGVFIPQGTLEAIACDGTNVVYQSASAALKSQVQSNALCFAAETPANSNKLSYTEQFDNAIWKKTSVTVNPNAVASPFGQVVADKIVEAAGSSRHYVYQTRTSTNETATDSVWVMAGERTRFRIERSNFDTYSCGAFFDLSAGTFTVDPANADFTAPSATMVNVGGGWWRCTFTVTKGAVNTNNYTIFQVIGAGGAQLYVGDGVSGLYLYGAQTVLGTSALTYSAMPFTNDYYVDFAPAITALTDGMVVMFKAARANAGACNLAVNNLPSRQLLGAAHQALQGGEIVAGGIVEAVWVLALSSWVMLGCTGGAQQVGTATQSWHSPPLAQVQGLIAAAVKVYADTAMTLVDGKTYKVDTANGTFPLTLPASPAKGAFISFEDVNFSWKKTPWTLARNGQKIMGIAADFTVDNVNRSFDIWFNGTEWRFV